MKLYVCRICGQDAHTFVQPALVVGRRRALQVHCQTPGCPNHLLTTDERDAALIDERFIVVEDDDIAELHHLDKLLWRIESLKRLESQHL